MAEEISLLEQAFAETGAQLDRIIAVLQRKDLAKTYAYYSDGSVVEYDIAGFLTANSIIKTNLVKVEIGNTVTRIEYGAFSGCSGLTSVTIPDSVTSIKQNAFYNCISLFNTSTIPGVKLVDGWAVECETTLAGELDLVGVRGVAAFAFYNCSSLTSITIPNSVTNIGDDAFSGCYRLTSVTIGSGVTSIGSHAFTGCSGLTSVTIPDSVTSIGDLAFSDTSIMNTHMTTKTIEQVQAMDYYPWGLPPYGTIHCSNGDLFVPDSGGSGS